MRSSLSSTLLFILVIAAAALMFNRVETEAQTRSDRVLSRTFNVSPGGNLEISVSAAHIELVPAAGNQAHVEISLTGRDMRQARALYEDLDFRVSQSGNTIRIESKQPRVLNVSRTRGTRIAVRVEIPTEFNANVQTSGGSITSGDLAGTARMSTSGGRIETGVLRGPSVQLTTSGGSIHAAGLFSDDVTLRTSGGHIEVGEARGSSIVFRTSGGRIRAEFLDGDNISARTSGGSITVGATLGNAELRTSGGSIQVGESEGSLSANTSGGSIRVSLTKTAGVDLRTSGGSITINAPASLRADLALSGTSVRLSSDFPFEGSLTRNRASGHINGGGPNVAARTSGGSVTLQTGN